MVLVEKRDKQRAHQTVGLIPYLFPSMAASSFDLEAPLRLEDTRERLDKLAQLRRPVPYDEGVTGSLWGMFASRGSKAFMPDSPTTTLLSPIEIRSVLVDDDTYRYEIVLNEQRFRVVVRGYIKRWEDWSTVLNGKVRFDLHYVSLLLKSVLYTIGAGALIFGVWFISWFIGFYVRLPDAIYQLFNTLSQPDTVKILIIPLWLLVLAFLWFNDVVLRAHASRSQLMIRIEDMLFLPYAGKS